MCEGCCTNFLKLWGKDWALCPTPQCVLHIISKLICYTSKWHDMCDDVCTHHTRTRSPPSPSWSSACALSDQCRHCEVTDAQCMTTELHSQRIFHNCAKRHPYEMFVDLGQHVVYTMIAVTRHACNTPCHIVFNRAHTLTKCANMWS